MRSPWRSFLLRTSSRSSLRTVANTCTQLQESNPNLQLRRSLSSFLFHNSLQDSVSFKVSEQPKNPNFRNFSSELALEHTDVDHVILTEIFSMPRSDDDVTVQLESNKINIDHDLVLKVLKGTGTSPYVALRLFNWVLVHESERLSSKSYNWMLGVLGSNGFMNEFWDLIEAMRRKGYGVCKGAFLRVSKSLEKKGLESDLNRLKEFFVSKDVNDSIERVCSRVCKVIRKEPWGDNVEKELQDLGIPFSSDLVAMVLEKISTEPMKALIFFRWVEESGLIKHDGKTYNAVARVLGREDCVEKFWGVVDEMRSNGFDMEKETYVRVLGRFAKRKMIKDAVNLYELAMGGANKPFVTDCTFLLKKIVVSRELDMGLFSRVLKVFVEDGNVLTDSTFHVVAKSLSSVGKTMECYNVLKAMQECGFVASSALQNTIASDIGSLGSENLVDEFINRMEAFGVRSSHKTWTSLIEGQCKAGNLDKAVDCFHKMVEKEGVSHAGYALNLLVNAFCYKKKTADACELLIDLVNRGQLKPWHSTYKLLINKLLVQGNFNDALSLIGLMKNDGFPPFLDPFMEYISRNGTGDDAVAFLKAMTVRSFPSTSVVLRVFEAFFKAGRDKEAQNILYKCPSHIKNHADVLNLFCSKTWEESNAAAVVVA
ncbi:Pentatricopeptide repeat [Dillenia turbinata]|uniref:Pentatricopeptide repeat n=1 Tax=Dillenia turbinata TaxID=194707 RepID=A0AAN8ZA92_9MAGN